MGAEGGESCLQELFVARRKEADQRGCEHSFDYFVLVDEAKVGDVFLCESYGVRVSAAESGDSCSVANITTSTQRIDELLELLVAHAVTPDTLRDVVDDWL